MSSFHSTEKEENEACYRVLSIQSHTVSGYCGNKAAVFPLQTLGFDVDYLNTVQFSNHTGYPSFTGTRLTADNVQELFEGLEANGLTQDYTHVLTGYIGNYAILEKIKLMVQRLKKANPNIIYVCDTVMGDGGKLYVAKEIIPLYRDILSVADVITPNQFEAETLTEMTIGCLNDTCKVTEKLHKMGSPNVVITTLTLSEAPEEIRQSTDTKLYCFTSQLLDNGSFEQYLISFPAFDGYFTGTGDLFSSLVVARLTEEKIKAGDKCSLQRAVYKVICTVNAITRNTFDHQQKWIKVQGAKPTEADSVRKCELQLIKGKKFIENPDLVGQNVVKFIKVDDNGNRK